MRNPLVSIIVTTKNEEKHIANCLESIKKQSYKNIEIIVVDNNSSDRTKRITEKYTKNIFNKGPERSAQRNFGAKKAKGEYLLFLDADMILTKNVVKNCVSQIEKTEAEGLIIPEKSFGTSWWAKTKALERSFYIRNDAIEAARFYSTKIFKKIGGFDEKLTGPEDWDLSQRVKATYMVTRIQDFILHNEGKLSLFDTIKKKYYYSKKIVAYLSKKESHKTKSKQTNIFGRYWIFLKHPKKLFQHPLLGISVLFMKTLEFAAGACGIIYYNFFPYEQ